MRSGDKEARGQSPDPPSPGASIARGSAVQPAADLCFEEEWESDASQWEEMARPASSVTAAGSAVCIGCMLCTVRNGSHSARGYESLLRLITRSSSCMQICLQCFFPSDPFCSVSRTNHENLFPAAILHFKQKHLVCSPSLARANKWCTHTLTHLVKGEADKVTV